MTPFQYVPEELQDGAGDDVPDPGLVGPVVVLCGVELLPLFDVTVKVCADVCVAVNEALLLELDVLLEVPVCPDEGSGGVGGGATPCDGGGGCWWGVGGGVVE